MRSNEKRWLVLGMLIGLMVAASLYGFMERRRSLQPAAATQGSSVESGVVSAAAPSETVADAYVELTEDEQEAIGLETAVVTRRTVRKEIVAPGKVVEPETGIAMISARISGRIDKLFLNVTGESVSRGQLVALIYSPEILTGAEEYKLALENRQRLSASKEPQAIVQAGELIQASRRRLELRGLTDEQIDGLAGSSELALQITTYSPMAGVVSKRNVAEGQYVKEGDVLYTIMDLSTVWIQADIFESDIPLVRNGQPVRITTPAAAGALRGVVNFLQPAVDPQTRTMTARIQVPNPQMRLRPGMFVQVSFESSIASDTVAVPRSAVIDTGKDKVVYVVKEQGVFEKRPVEASEAGDEYYAVTMGLIPGERVVTQGNFLIDSQTRLSGNMSGMFGGSKAFGNETLPSSAAGSNYTITLRSEPAPPKGGSEATFHVTVTGPDGRPVTDAQVQTTLVMPGMPTMGMPEMRSSINLMWDGAGYVGAGTIGMAGSWNASVEVRRGGQLLGVYRTRFQAR